MPSPEVDRRDAKLARALEELARWNEPQPVGIGAAKEAEDEEIPQPIAEPIPIEVPVPPEPISVKSPPSVEPQIVGMPPPVAGGELNVAAAIDELARMTVEGSPRRHAEEAVIDEPRRHRGASRGTTLLIIAASVLAAFAGGFFTARLRPIPPVPAELVPPVREAAAVPAISGRITYKTKDGESLPDRGARILVLPREREGTVKLAAVGTRAADHPADVRLATAALRALGGDLAVADDEGKYSVQLPNPGTYHIIVVSNYAQRDGAETIDPELLRPLAPFFEQPAQVIGRTQVHFGQVRYKGTGTEAWDHSF